MMMVSVVGFSYIRHSGGIETHFETYLNYWNPRWPMPMKKHENVYNWW